MDKKLPDSEIVKALEGAYKIEPTTMFFITDYNTNKITTIGIGDIVDLINRQKAEIERLSNEVKSVTECKFESVSQAAKSEAYKEFAERLKAVYEGFDDKNEVILYSNLLTAIDCLLIGMVGDSNAE